MGALKDTTFTGSVIIGGSLTFSGASRVVNLNTSVSSLLLPGGLDLATVAVSTVLGRASSGVLAALTALPAVSGALVTALNATQLTSGTVPDARFPVLLPTACKVDASNITAGTLPDARFPATLPSGVAVSAANLTTGTIPDARFPSTLPAIGGVNLTSLNASNLDTGTIPDARFGAALPAVSGAALTALNATALNSGTIPDARFPSVLPSTVGISASTNLTAGTIPDARFPSVLPAISGANLTNIPIANITGLFANVAAFLAAPSSSNLRAMITDESGTGALLFAGGALGTPATGNLIYCTGLPVATGISGLASGVATFLATPSSANFRTMITDESGTGALLFAGGALGTPASGTLTNCTIPNLTGHVTSVGNATSLGSFTLAQLSMAVSDAVVARTDAAQTFAGTQTFGVLISSDITSSGNIAAGSAGTSAGQFRLYSDGHAYRVSQSAGTLTANRSWSFPDSDNTFAGITGPQAFSGVHTFGDGIRIGNSATQEGVFIFSATGATEGSTIKSLAAASTAEQVIFLPDTAGTADVFAFTDLAQTLRNKAIIVTQNSQSGNYTLVLTDASKDILHPASSGSGDVFTIPANASVAFAIGTRIGFINRDTTNAVSIAINTDTLTLSPGGTTGTRTLAAYGIATAVKITSTEWMISGTGLT